MSAYAGVMNALARGLDARRKAKAAARYRAGWDYAAGEVLLGTDVERIRSQVLCGQFFSGKNPFDDGALDCLLKAERLFTQNSLFEMPATMVFGQRGDISLQFDQDVAPPITAGDRFRILVKRRV